MSYNTSRVVINRALHISDIDSLMSLEFN